VAVDTLLVGDKDIDIGVADGIPVGIVSEGGNDGDRERERGRVKPTVG
jgi:uncharacterized protein (DUF779 family)